MIELSPENLSGLREIFADYPYLRGQVASVLGGEMGVARVDNARHPTVGCLCLPWVHMLAGDFSSSIAGEMIKSVPSEAALVAASTEWKKRIRESGSKNLEAWTRTAFGSGAWDSDTLKAFTQNIPDGYVIKRVTTAEVAGLTQVADWLICNYSSYEDFLDRGIGFVVEYDGKIVSGCSSYTVGGGKIDIGIATSTDFQRCGLATAVAAKMILYCLENGIEPCWDATTAISANLAKKLGFADPVSYTAYILR